MAASCIGMAASRSAAVSSCPRIRQLSITPNHLPHHSNTAVHGTIRYNAPSFPSNYQNPVPTTQFNFDVAKNHPASTSYPFHPSSYTTGVGKEFHGQANGNGNVQDIGMVPKEEYGKFVQFFRQASPYIAGHRSRTFVIVIPGEVIVQRQLLQGILDDIGLIHGLGVRLVLVLGAAMQIDTALQERGMSASYVRGYRVTDADSLELAVEAAGRSRILVEQYLSKGPSVPVMRRHAKTDTELHFAPAMRVVSGNYVAAKRRGIVDGVDFGYTGEVRFVMKTIQQQLDDGNIALLTNLGYTTAGEVLNCNVHDVGLHAAVELCADKLFCLHLDDVGALDLPQWLPLSDANDLLMEHINSLKKADSTESDITGEAELPSQATQPQATNMAFAGARPKKRRLHKHDDPHHEGHEGHSNVNGNGSTKFGPEGLMVNLDVWNARGLPNAVSACLAACSKGVKRAHLVDARTEGGMLLELYTRDGVGTMISTDFYEGIRKARPGDVDGIYTLLSPLVKEGVVVERPREELSKLVPNFIVLERETKVMGCALLLPLGASDDGVPVAEIGAFCVDPAFRGSGRGDSLLDYVEQEARARDFERLVLLTTRTADWFAQRDFIPVGPAWGNKLLPEERRLRINPQRNSQLYAKDLAPRFEDLEEPGKRIGF